MDALMKHDLNVLFKALAFGGPNLNPRLGNLPRRPNNFTRCVTVS